MRAPAALVALPLLVGVVAGIHAAADPDLAVRAAGAACLALVAAAGARADSDAAVCSAIVALGALLVGIALGCDAARRVYAPPLLEWYHARTRLHPVALQGTLREDASAGPFGVSIHLDVERAGDDPTKLQTGPISGGIRLTVAGRLAPERLSDWRAGRRVRLAALLRVPPFHLDPGVADARPGLARRGVVLVGSVKSATLVEIVSPGPWTSEAGASIRAWVRTNLADLVGRWDRRSGAIATAILIGDRTGLSDDDELRLQKAGTYHVIAISGGNIAILTLLLIAAARLLRLPPRVAACAIAAVLLFYARIAAPAPSVNRAVTAAVAYLAARLLDQRAGIANVLAVAAALAVAAEPVTVLDPGFILSFGATLGILSVAPRIMRSVPRPPYWLARAALALVAATIAAELALAPVSATLFSRMTAAGLVLNFAAIPLMTCVQAGSIVALAVGSVSRPAADAAGYGVHLAATGLVESARLVDVAPWLAPPVQPPGWPVLAVYYSSIAAALLLRRFRRAAALLALAALLAAASGACATTAPPKPPGSLRVVFLDVGQGDATLVHLPDRRALLVDSGGLAGFPAIDRADGAMAYDIGERVVVPAIRALRVRRLDAFVVTHADPDHIGGAQAVVRNLRPRAIWEGVPVPPHPARRALVDLAERDGAEWRAVQAGDAVRIAGVDIRVLHPPQPDWERQRVRNDDSVVLEIRFGEISIVLPGDIGREGEQAVRAHVTPAGFVVLKAPHHGSATSSGADLLEALRPSVAVFSAGRANRFGHPAPSVVGRYRALGTAMFSTADDGAVVLDTDGTTVRVRGWTGREMVYEAKPGSRRLR